MRCFRRHATLTTAAIEFRFCRSYKLIFGSAPFVLNINQSDNLKEYTMGYQFTTLRVRSHVVEKFDRPLQLSVSIFSSNMNVDENGKFIFLESTISSKLKYHYLIMIGRTGEWRKRHFKRDPEHRLDAYAAAGGRAGGCTLPDGARPRLAAIQFRCRRVRSHTNESLSKKCAN